MRLVPHEVFRAVVEATMLKTMSRVERNMVEIRECPSCKRVTTRRLIRDEEEIFQSGSSSYLKNGFISKLVALTERNFPSKILISTHSSISIPRL